MVAIALALAAASALAAPPPAPGWTHATWGLRDGLPVLTFSGICQAADGYLWMSTFDGLVRFDGAHFDVLDAANHPELTSSRFGAILPDPAGGLWVSSESDGLLRFEGGEFRPVKLEGELLRAPASPILAIQPGRAIVLMATGVFEVQGTTARRIPGTPYLRGLRGAYLDRAGDVWWVGSDSTMWLHAGRVHAAPLPESFVRGDPEGWWHVTSDGALWFETAGRVWRAVDGRLDGAARPVPAIRPVASRYAGPPFVRGFRTPDGASWEAVDRRVLRDGVTVMDVGAPVVRMLTDRDGTVWVAATNGLHRIARAVVSVVGADAGGKPNVVSVVYQDRRDRVWLLGVQGIAGRWGDDGYRWAAPGFIFTGLVDLPGEGLVVSTWGGVRHMDERMVVGPQEPNAPYVEVGLLHADPDGTLWAAMHDTLWVRRQRAWERWRGAMPREYIRSALRRPDGSHWFGTAGAGIVVLRGEVLERIGAGQGLLNERVRGMYEDEHGVVWAATEGGGLARIELPAGAPAARARVRMMRKHDGLLDDVLHAIVEDAQGRLWISTNRGIFCVPRARLDAFAAGDTTAISIRAFGEAQGMVSRECNGVAQPAAIRARDGTLWFATQAGAVVIDPRRVPVESPVRTVAIEDVVARGERVRVEAGRVRLSPRQREFSIAYSSPEFLAPQQLRFRYRLRERGADWVEAGERRTAYFTDLAPGRHTFEVQASSGGPWSPPATLRLEVQPRWFETLPFRLGVLVAALAAAFAAYRRRLRALESRGRELAAQVAARTADLVREKLETERARAAAESARAVAEAERALAVTARAEAEAGHAEAVTARAEAEAGRADALAARAEAESARLDAEHSRDLAQRSLETIEEQASELRRLDAAKSRFFANVSHEFRTPLTLTIGPLEDMLGGAYGALDEETREPLELALRNANRALAQVNRILDLARLESGGMTLQASEGDLGRAARALADLFAPLAARRGVALATDVQEGVIAWFDPGLLEQAVANLLSNALKFTPAGGHVRLTGRMADDGGPPRYALAVRDDGPGIAVEEQPRLFERFYQAAGAREVTHPGTGIGLSLTRDIVELHGGTLALESAPGAGSTFTLTLPLGRAHLRDDQLAAGVPPPSRGSAEWLLADAAAVAVPVTAPVTAASDAETDAPTVLVVEDEPEVRGYLRGHLAPHYRVVEAADGREGLAAARIRPPDLVISDLMMPVMDGFALCEAMQADADLAGTPFIMLTARATLEDRLAGLALGAVDYLAKPFHAAELLLRVRNLLATQRRLREKLRPRELHAVAVVATSEGDRFLARVREAIEQHMSEEDFDVERLARESGVSRAHLFRRLRELLDETPELLLRRLRLERAAQLLEQRAGNVGEVAYATGFKSVAWFCRVFREKYGTTPGAYAESRRVE